MNERMYDLDSEYITDYLTQILSSIKNESILNSANGKVALDILSAIDYIHDIDDYERVTEEELYEQNNLYDFSSLGSRGDGVALAPGPSHEAAA